MFFFQSKNKKQVPEPVTKKQPSEEYKASPVNVNVEDKILREAVRKWKHIGINIHPLPSYLEFK